MEKVNLVCAWIGIVLGAVTGAVQGMFFHDEKWLGGYGSWQRRMTRLGHISFFGLAILNLAFAFTVSYFEKELLVKLPSYLLILGAIDMPLSCYLSAYGKHSDISFTSP